MNIYVIIDNPDLRKFIQPEEYRLFRNKQGNPGFVRRNNASDASFSDNVHLDLIKAKRRPKLSAKVKKITELNSRAKSNLASSVSSSKLVSSPPLVVPSSVSSRPVRSTRAKVNYNLDYLTSAAGLAAASAKREDPLPLKSKSSKSSRGMVRFSKSVIDDEFDGDVLPPSSSDIDSGED